MIELAIVLGGAECLWDDAGKTADLIRPATWDDVTVVACNDAGYLWPHRLDHWVTLHHRELWAREARREQRGHPGGYVTWTNPQPAGVEHPCDRELGGWGDGSSGLLALGVALQVSEHAILCGIPISKIGHVDRDEGAWEAAIHYQDTWTSKLPEIRERVRSWSGWTAKVLDEPNARWLSALTGAPAVR